eukprot:scaffold1736_cov127-Cylindrotheca_fusiformis.AAC.9
MGKNYKRRRQHHQQVENASKANERRGHRTSESISHAFKKSDNSLPELPLPFPSHLPFPSYDFLRNEEPYKESFHAALRTSYEGFVVDDSLVGLEEATVSQYLELMLQQKYFRRDVTQPFGLGTKCAKTYVTRCLMGEPGTTYKYLGLRMFAHPWQKGAIQKLASTLTERTRQHLNELDKKRCARNAPKTKGRADFDICLINRMEALDDLKSEPTIGNAKTTVSWHADSSLEHYSTIAVYQTFLPPKKKGKNKDGRDSQSKWFVALRVAHNSEGPQSSRRGTDIESSIVKETPPIAASLPSGSAYYMLDDFNHHHQHTVLTNGDLASAGVRYSCTFRLLRESHNVDHMIARCQAACSNFHKKGSKLWRSEQLLLTELESEWIRQFYIQGSQHHDLLWPSWKEPIEALLRYWSQLERRTHQTIELLKAAAEQQCGFDPVTVESSDAKPSRAVRKARERRKKALVTLEELLARSNNSESEDDTIYEPLAELIESRSAMRGLWMKREHDHVFRELGMECRPMKLPLQFNVSEGIAQTGECGISPMEGSPAELKKISQDLLQYGKAFQSKKLQDLPLTAPIGKSGHEDQEHSKSLDWSGWSRFVFGLELQEPWAQAVVEGKKPIETRSYDLPPSLLGKRVMILQSPAGKAGVSGMGNVMNLSDPTSSGAMVIGWVIFHSVKKYTTRETFEADEKGHLVAPGSDYGWKEGKTKVIYGWIVGEYGSFASNGCEFHSATRRMRSLFQLRGKKEASIRITTVENGNRPSKIKSNYSSSEGKRKKKRRKRF